jgi:hypothetical protein
MGSSWLLILNEYQKVSEEELQKEKREKKEIRKTKKLEVEQKPISAKLTQSEQSITHESNEKENTVLPTEELKNLQLSTNPQQLTSPESTNPQLSVVEPIKSHENGTTPIHTSSESQTNQTKSTEPTAWTSKENKVQIKAYICIFNFNKFNYFLQQTSATKSLGRILMDDDNSDDEL